MQTKLQELTEKIYSEGVEKAKLEADAIIKAAQEKAKAIEQEALSKADSIVAEAESKAESLKLHIESELKMSIGQAVAALKQTIANTVCMKAIQPSVKELFGDKEFLKGLIGNLIKGFAEKGAMDLLLILPEKDRQELETYYKNQLASELNKGLELSFSDGVRSGFKIGPADGSYIISFSDTDFTNFFKDYLRPKTKEILFDK
ncbi:V-type ATP synthase subunit E [Xiashengella succiniciproducens]|jgi:V/A-type H+-transporting ATPase subunit E|uniref:V-type ATP synthase subunit E n=1 Tax=Xiashengella succiniciproducens TaxID=2949635 RepID=A0A9J6ZMN4_9BACT|nr:V-type ATP synthase subunit E [Alkaliflexus sp. Ai-910]MDI9539619.1 V-type ATP synthase subunit E [Bacteroidota bacterium]URW79146.1 V-type ATP synthase subunit E [Alkaliflexus sp. Ai-910]HHU01026.1 V-type ATP synthase subunit E [Bacteroidales bacterium]